jgi:hypothetical protein
MLEYYFERKQRVLMASISGTFDTEQALRLDRAVSGFARHEPGLRALYDFTELERIDIPDPFIAARARQPTAVGGVRVIVASRTMGSGMARAFSDRQSDAGERAPIVVERLEEAYALLGLAHDARFSAVRLD